ncbi:MAG: Wzz/FepE/Etk N-terminal domain-containing protein, partial [Thermodesulfobacteriota bacterium]|nr:Wzz/FepE/Etk N-terminal domain-containing protein [Thermodesulfobacteriota bacterium]
MAQYDVDLREYWRILKKRKFTVLIITVFLGLFSTLFAVLKAPAPLYTSVCSIRIEKDATAEGIYARSFAWSSGDDIDTQVSVLQSYSVIQEAAKKLGLIPEESTAGDSRSGSNSASIIDGLQSRVEVSREGFTNIVNIAVTDSDPALAKLTAETIALTYREMHKKEQNRKSMEAIKYITEQLKNVRQELRDSEDEFNRFTQENQLVSIDLQSENLLLRGKEARDRLRKLDEAEDELGDLLVKLENFTANPSGVSNDLYSTYANKSYKDTNDTLVGLLLKRDSLLEDFTEKHPEVIAIKRKIIETARKMGIILHLQINNTHRKKMDARNELATIDNTTSDLMEKKLEFDRLKRKVDSYNDMAALLERKNQEALIRKAEKPEGISVVRPAHLPTFPVNPPRTMTTGGMGIIIGLILGMIAAFIAETFDTSLGAIEDVEETLGTQVLGVIPHGDLKSIQEGASSSFRQNIYLVSHFVPQTMLAESFRGLRTSIQLQDVEKKLKILVFTSASPQEGKTMVSSNLAITMAQAGIKTMLVESDLRKPRLAQVFGIES